ncbi:unnamed protein product [Owenia fusiformis]|uniref:Uncharacterized protein n=1 Tax=Owenia fusiformis TaxID=6347 RepID=A0A8J1UN70_OWEFU|nr:unnamed protein product [Owenia fusiformis]
MQAQNGNLKLLIPLILLGGAALIVLVVCGATIVREFVVNKLEFNGREFEAANCHVTSVDYENQKWQECEHCYTTTTIVWENNKPIDRLNKVCVESRFPCLQIHVMYRLGADLYARYGEDYGGILRLHPWQLEGIYSQCSYNICRRYEYDNEREIRSLQTQWLNKMGEKFTCYYNPSRPWEIVAKKMATRTEAIVSMTIPSFVLIVAVMAIGFVLICKDKFNKKKIPMYNASQHAAPSRENIADTGF